MARDYYEVLGVSQNADSKQVKKAFRDLAMKYHPDVSEEADAEAKFKEINEAYEVLSDDNKRARYDRFGHAGVGGAGMGGGAAGFGGFEDIFEEIWSAFGGRGGGSTRGSRRQNIRVGSDRRVEVTISFEESIFGVEKEIEFQRLEVCTVCDGNGAEEGSHPETCSECNGAGQVRRLRQTFLGSVMSVDTCPRCGGSGSVISNPCRNCDGSGRKRDRVSLNVKIPAGVREGLEILVRGEGDAGERSAPSGNLFVMIHVKDHAYFKRRENDVILDVNINVAQAALGDVITIETLYGDEEITIQPGTPTGKVYRLRGKGIPRLRSDGSTAGKGDQLVYITVAVPSQLTNEQRELFEQLGESFGHEIQVQSNGRGFFDRMMDFISGEPR